MKRYDSGHDLSAPKKKTLIRHVYIDYHVVAKRVTGNNWSERHIDPIQEADFVILWNTVDI